MLPDTWGPGEQVSGSWVIILSNIEIVNTNPVENSKIEPDVLDKSNS